MKKYTKAQLRSAILFWESKLAQLNGESPVKEDVNKAFKVKRKTDDARKAAIDNSIEAGDPMCKIVELHNKAVLAAKKACKNEIKGADDKDASKFEKVAIFNSCIQDGRWVDAGGDSSNMVITASIHMPSKKGMLARLFTGSLSKLGTVVGVAALRAYTKTFLGDSFARQVDNKRVFDGIDKQKDRVKYYVAFKLLNKSTKLDEKDEPDQSEQD